MGEGWPGILQGVGGQGLLFLPVGAINTAAMRHSGSDLRSRCPMVFFFFFPSWFFLASAL